MIIEKQKLDELSKKHDVEWAEIIDLEIKPGKSYIISNKKFNYLDEEINVLEINGDLYRRVATRPTRKHSPYLNFDIAVENRKRKSKGLLLHRARLIAFCGEDESRPFARHGHLGGNNHDLLNLKWGTHTENMQDVKDHGTNKGEKNSSSKISESIVIVIYALSQLGLINSKTIEYLPIKKGAVAAIRTRRRWLHIITNEIQALVEKCKEEHINKTNHELEKELKKQRLHFESEIANLEEKIKKMKKTLSLMLEEN